MKLCIFSGKIVGAPVRGEFLIKRQPAVGTHLRNALPELPRLLRRPVCLSQAAMADSSSWR